MKETKVWIDGEFPQVYFDPKTGNESIEGRPFILEDIKTHDRELVEKVCEKIKKKARWLWYFVYAEQKDYFKGNRYVLSEKDLNEIFDQIQKEYEK